MVPTLAPRLALETRAHARIADHQCRSRQIDHRIEIDTAKNDTGIPGAAGRSTIVTLTPEWRPTPEARTTDLRVRCLSM
jgi:hypothetical protein